jgi:hypothetical protein
MFESECIGHGHGSLSSFFLQEAISLMLHNLLEAYGHSSSQSCCMISGENKAKLQMSFKLDVGDRGT